MSRSFWGPLNWVPLYWTLRSYYNYKRHGFPCTYRSKYIESSSFLKPALYIIKRESAFWSKLNEQIIGLSNAKENDSEKKINLSNTTLTSKTNVENGDNADKDSYPRQYKNISEHTLTVIIIILPVYFQWLSSILKPWISFHCLVSCDLAAYTDYNYDHWLFVHLWQLSNKSASCWTVVPKKQNSRKLYVSYKTCNV